MKHWKKSIRPDVGQSGPGYPASRKRAALPPLLISAAILACMLVYIAFFAALPKGAISFRVRSDSARETVDPWFHGKECTVFLPSCADAGTVTVRLKKGCRVTVDGQALHDADGLDGLSLNTDYEMRVAAFPIYRRYRLRILRSSAAASMFIETATGTMNAIHADKNHKEEVHVRLTDAAGKQRYSGRKDKLSGRGNSTWNWDKKPYLLSLSEESSLLDMAPAKKWVLLANEYDPSNLRNLLIYRFAQDAGMEWTPSCALVDLYLNHEYAGLYLLSEQVDAGLNRLRADADAGRTNFLCKTEDISRTDSLDHPFVTAAGRTVEITWPKTVLTSQIRQITADVQRMEDAILSGRDEDILEYLDLDSWVRKYLIDELFANSDADLTSNFFYCRYEGDRPRFYAGPVWDYDVSLGREHRNENPESFVAAAKYEAPDHHRVYYDALCQNRIFRERVVSVYRQEFLPLLKTLTDRQIAEEAAQIEDAARMNQTRWFGSAEPFDPSAFTGYLNRRIAFFNRVWLENEPYHAVLIVPDLSRRSFTPYAVRDGAQVPAHAFREDADGTPLTYTDLETGAVFDPDQPVRKDTMLVPRKNPAKNKTLALAKRFWTVAMRHKLLLLCAGILALELLGLTVAHCRRTRHKKEPE